MRGHFLLNVAQHSFHFAILDAEHRAISPLSYGVKASWERIMAVSSGFFNHPVRQCSSPWPTQGKAVGDF
jgi:hypothetical protein